MQKLCIFDKNGQTAEMIQEMDFWVGRKDCEIQSVIGEEEKLWESLKLDRPDILILVKETAAVFPPGKIKEILSEYLGMYVIVIGVSNAYSVVRDYFRQGVYDYMVQPFRKEELENSLQQIAEEFGLKYVMNNLAPEIDALIQHIYQGGGAEREIIDSILQHIAEDYQYAPVNVQIIADRARYRIYEILIGRKPWLENFLYRKDFIHQIKRSVQSREEIARDWLKCFKEASRLVTKYQMIDDKLVYRIGKYAVVHVNEKLTLKSVAEGIYLNPSYVSHIFKKVTGMSFMDFVLEVKIDRAKMLLHDENIRICDVAEELSYNNTYYFSRKFKEKTGYTPMEYKLLLKEEPEGE